ncbi:MAG TPA: cytochrome c [Kaistia sp.]|nr:cytochrome c [Kaistia sp.]
MMRRLRVILASILAALVVLAVAAFFLLLRPVAQPETNDLAELFAHGSIGNEESQGLPYWIWRVLPQLFPDDLPGNKDGYGTFGVFWPRGAVVPVGFSVKTLGVIPRVAPNCAFCHQGSYRLHASDVSQIVSAGAGTRVNPQAYIRFLMNAGSDPRFNADTIMTAIAGIYDMPWWERALYRFVLIPATRTALMDQKTRFAWMTERPDWGPGRIDPFNPVKFQNLGLRDDGTIGNSDMMPLWSMGNLAETNTRRFSLHWDGLQTDLHETVVSGAIGDGMSYKSYPRTETSLGRMMDFIRLQGPPASPFSALRPPTDPYHVDAAAVEAGRTLYTSLCASCHEPYGARYRTPIPIVELGTDRHRLDMWTPAALERYTAYEPGYHWGFSNFHKTEGYVAVGLEGLWLRGPYLHNGSVPTLRALLEAPSKRPSSFYRGYDLVDPENGGFVSTPGTDGAKYGVLFDTAVPGNSNEGHLWGTDLPQSAKENLLAFLKTL